MPTDPARSVITVGDGRGFVVTTRHVQLIRNQIGEWRSLKRARRLIITAAHCLPHLPPCHGASYTEERTYANLIGPLGETPSVWTECLFADPIADIAVLGEPDGQALFKECEAYETLIEATPALHMVDPKENTGRSWLLSLNRQWISCEVEHNGGPWLIRNASKPGIQGGMSGSPILNHNRSAVIGVGRGLERGGMTGRGAAG